MRWVAVLMVFGIGGAGCDLLVPLGGAPTDGAPDRQTTGDSLGVDHDSGAVIDVGLAPDATLDAPAPPPDLTLPPDLPADATVISAACSVKAVQTTPYTSTRMAVCATSGASATIMQCDAHQLCNAAAGWHLCTKTEFIANGGQLEPSPTMAWIAGCSQLVAGTSQYGPVQDGVCGCASTGKQIQSTGIWDCSGVAPPPSQTGDDLAPVAFSECRRLGVNKPTSAAYWHAYYSYLSPGVQAALCCTD